jgi:hypothetical protein
MIVKIKRPLLKTRENLVSISGKYVVTLINGTV